MTNTDVTLMIILLVVTSGIVLVVEKLNELIKAVRSTTGQNDD